MKIRERLRRAYRALTTDDFQKKGLMGPPVHAGVDVNPSTAEGISAYWCALNCIAGDIGVMDRILYKRVGDDDRERATGHYLYRLLHDEPNEYMVPQVFWETLMRHALSWGNGIAEIEFDRAMRPIALWPILPNQIAPRTEVVIDASGRRSTKLFYEYTGSDRPRRLEAWEVFHIPGPGYDGIRGYSVVQVARQSLGLTIAAEQYGAGFFGRGASIGIALEHPGELSTAAHDRLKKSFTDEHVGVDVAHAPLILEEGMKVSKPITIPPDDAQFLETRTFQIEEIARWFNIPPYKLKHKMGDRPGGNLEASQTDYQQGTLLPWETRIEQEAIRKLVSKQQRGTHYIEHNHAKLLRADTKTRTAAYEKLFEMGVLDADTIARLENLPKPKPKPEPEAAAPAPGPEAAPPAPADPPETPQRAQTSARHVEAVRGIVAERLGQYVRREAARVRKAVGAGPAEFGTWVSDFYKRDQVTLLGILEPVMALVLSAANSTEDPAAAARRLTDAYVAESREALVSLGARNLSAEAEKLVQRWESDRAADLTRRIMAAFEEQEVENAA